MPRALPRVLLIHGLLNADWWLLPLARRLRAQGFATELFGYSSVWAGPQAAVPALLERLRTQPVDALVGHSLGGLVALEALRAAGNLPVTRVVCLGSPLLGSHTARALASQRWSAAVLGRSADLLRSGVPPWCGAAQVGVVAGDVARGMGRLFARFDEPSDGTVAVSETRLAGLTDHCQVHASHTGLVLSSAAARQTGHFLRDGRFHHESEGTDV